MDPKRKNTLDCKPDRARSQGIERAIYMAISMIALVTVGILMVTGLSWKNTFLDIKDGGLLSDTPCGPPCFLNIIPGITTEEKLYQILEEREMKENCKSYDNSIRGGSRGIVCNDRINITFARKTNKVSTLGFYPSGPVYVREIIEKYGNPDHVVMAGGGRTAKLEPIAWVLLFYDSLHMYLHLAEKPGMQYALEANTTINLVIYTNEKEYRSFENQFESWNGYGS